MLHDPESYPPGHWIPYKLQPTEEGLNCRWLYLTDELLSAPFFEDTQQRALKHPYNSGYLSVVSSLDWIIEMAPTVQSVAPSAFIFHVSRCGSTLLSQLLSLNQRHIVLSEAPLLDHILRLSLLTKNRPVQQQEQLFQAVLRLLSQPRSGQETHLFVKLDSWHLMLHETIRRLFPTTPFILLYRSPDEVVQSHRKRRGMQAIPGLIAPEFFGFTTDQIAGIDLDVYMATILHRYFETMIQVTETDPNCLLLNYQAAGMSMMRELIAFLNLNPTEAEYAAMVHRCGYHGKYPEQKFLEDTPKAELSDYLQPALSLFRQLEQLRLGYVVTK